ncbi:MAG: GxxExxY protein [bacterium]
MDRLARDVIGAAIEVHSILSPGFIESLYKEALAIEFGRRKIPFRRQVLVGITYKSTSIGEARLDFLVDESLIVDLKAVEALLPIHTAQVISYLKATRLKLGLLFNFNVTALKDGIHRIVQS